MIDEHTLHERLDDAVSGASIDLHGLTAAAQHEGRRIRRRRRAGSLAATTLVTTGVVLGIGWAVAGSVPGTQPVPAPPPASNPTPAHVVAADVPQPATGRATAAALTEIVSGLQVGTASDFSGHHTRPGALARGMPLLTLGALRWTPGGADASVPVRVTVQDGWTSADASEFSCEDAERTGCSVAHREGRVVVSYEEHDAGAVDRFVDVWLQERGLRVTVSTTNARQIGTDPTVLLAQPPLTLDELRTIALDPVWGPTVPTRYVRAGQDLPSFRDTGTP